MVALLLLSRKRISSVERGEERLDFFVALGYWKLAIILEGVYARYAAGQYGKVNPGIEAFERLADAAGGSVAVSQVERAGILPALSEHQN